MPRLVRFLLPVLFLLMLTAACTQEQEKQETENTLKAPHFSITTLSGNYVSLNDYLDKKALLLVFWTTWCPGCIKEMPKINELAMQYSYQLAVLGINSGWNDSLERTKSYKQKLDPDFPLAFDHGQQVTSKFSIQGVPSIFLVDKKGIIRYFGHGVSDKLIQELQALMQ